MKKMILSAMQPFAAALMDFFKGEKSSTLIMHRDDHFIEKHQIKTFFREYQNFYPLEKKAIELCSGNILDVGAGVGPHSLVLKKKGFDVLSIDIIPEACEIMKKRGLENVRCIDFHDLKDICFDIIILMGRTIGIVGDLNGLDKFLRHANNLLNPKGKILLDSGDVRKTTNQKHLAYHKMNLKANRYIGMVNLHFEYKDLIGQKFQLIHIDPQTLIKRSLKNNYFCEIIHKEENGSYLASLSLK